MSKKFKESFQCIEGCVRCCTDRGHRRKKESYALERSIKTRGKRLILYSWKKSASSGKNVARGRIFISTIGAEQKK